MKFVVIIKLKFKNPFKVKENEASEYILKSLNLAHKIAIKGEAAGVINCPINKNLLKMKKMPSKLN